MKKTKIANRQMGFILFMMRSTIILSFLPVLTSADALQDAWISALVTLVASLLITAAIVGLSRRYPQDTIVNYSQRLWGKWLGKLIGFTFLWIFLQMAVLDLRIYGEVINTNFLTRTPITFIVGIILLAATICVYQGLEVLGRMADFLFITYIIMVGIVLIIPFTAFEGKNLEPVFVRGWGPIIKGSLVPIALISQSWVIGVLAPNLTKPRQVIKTSLLAIGLSLVVLTLFAVVIVGVLGPFEGSRSVFPLFSMIRSVEVSEFLQRTEMLIIFSWGMGIFVSAATYLYAMAVTLSDLLDLSTYRSLIWPIAVIWVILTVDGFESMFVLNSFLKPEVYFPYGMVIILLPLSLFWLASSLKNLGSKGERGK